MGRSHQPGSNGGVHRGPDRQLRVNVVRSLLLEALAKDGVGRRRRHRSKIPMALVVVLTPQLNTFALSVWKWWACPAFLAGRRSTIAAIAGRARQHRRSTRP